MSKDGIMVRGNGDDESFLLETEEWTNSKYTLNPETKEITEEVEGRFRQYPIRLAWAITIHKSQGLTFERAIIDANASFAHGQVYVALSRCKSLEGLVLGSPLRIFTLWSVILHLYSVSWMSICTGFIPNCWSDIRKRMNYIKRKL